MIAALLLAAAAPAATPAPRPKDAIEAERAFARDAQARGQWTAFKMWSTPDALMFTPLPVKAHTFFKDFKDPPVAVFWWPGASFVSCDGGTAVNTGPWVREWGKSVGYFTTVWQRQPGGGWKWIYDAGDTLKQARGEGGDITPRIATCTDRAKILPAPIAEYDPGIKFGHGESADGTLRWTWAVTPQGERYFRAFMWTGRTMERIVDDHVPGAKT